MKNKRIVIIIILSFFTVCISIFAYIKINNIKKLKADASDPAYKRAGFACEEIYKCVIDEYNKMPEHQNIATYDTVLTDNQIGSISNEYTDYQLYPWKPHDNPEDEWIYNLPNDAFVCDLTESAYDKEINLQGLDKLPRTDEIFIRGTAKKNYR